MLVDAPEDVLGQMGRKIQCQCLFGPFGWEVTEFACVDTLSENGLTRIPEDQP